MLITQQSRRHFNIPIKSKEGWWKNKITSLISGKFIVSEIDLDKNKSWKLRPKTKEEKEPVCILTDSYWLKRFEASIKALSFSSACASACLKARSASIALVSATFSLDLSSSIFLCCDVDATPLTKTCCYHLIGRQKHCYDNLDLGLSQTLTLTHSAKHC